MITTTYNFSSGSGFIYNSSLIGFSGGHALLLLKNNPSQSFLPNLPDSSFNPSLLQYTSGSLNQVDKRPSMATFYAAWNSMLAANWSGPGNGSLAVTPFNGAAITSGKLDLTGSTNKYVTFSGINNCDSAQTGTIEFEVTPNYSGAPLSQQIFFSISPSPSSTLSAIIISHYIDGNVYFQLFDNANNLVIDSTFMWNPVAGTKYKFLINFDGAGGTGANQLYIDDISVIISPASFDRTGQTLANAVIGRYYNLLTMNADFSIENFSFYSSSLIPSSPILPSTIYSFSTANLPEFSYAGLGNVQSWNSLTISDSNSPAYIFNGLYFNGSTWVTSDGSYSQANIASEAAAHISTLPVSNTLQIDVVFPAGNLHTSLTSIDVGYTGQNYSTNGPTISPNMSLTMDELSSFMDVHSASGSDAVSWFLSISGTNYWFNGSDWVISDGTYLQSNPASVINTNASTLPISLGAFVIPIAILHSNDGSTTPNLTSLTVEYDYFGPPPPGPNKCTVFGYLKNERGNPVVGAIMTVTNPSTFINQGIVEVQGNSSSVSDIDGYFHFDLFETTTANVPLQWSVVYPFTGVPNNTFNFGSALIPNTPEINFSSLVFS